LVPKRFTKRSSSSCNQIGLNKLIKIPFKTAPSCAQFAPRGNVFWEPRVERGQPGSKHTAVRLGEKHCDPATEAGELIPLRSYDFGDQAFSPKTA
jgi:hypothetical protein